MLETLLKHLRSYGMNDLEFIIVNSKLPHSQDKIEELRERVSFEVFQETEVEEVWNLMEGGKDDMYIYDRCGRLTYYIPFPLSILTESPLVSNAVLATYFRSPCGDKCDENDTVDIEEVVKNIESDLESSNVTEEANVTDFTPEDSSDNATTISNDVLNIIDPLVEEIDDFNFTDITNDTDYDNLLHNETSEHFDRNTTSVDEAKTYFNSIYKLFFNNNVNDENTPNNTEILANETQSNLTSSLVENDNDTQSEDKRKNHLHHHSHHSHHHHGHHGKSQSGQKKKPHRCLEADYEVCKGWSKNHLLHAQKCCSALHTHRNADHSKAEEHDPIFCAPFTKKRCKKIQSILKCCIKTVKTDSSTVSPSVETATEPHVGDITEIIQTESTNEPSPVTSSTSEVATSPTDSTKQTKSGINCCKSTVNGPSCRVSFTGCTENEYTYHAPGPAK